MRYDLVDQYYPLEPDPAFRRRAAWLLAQLEGLPRGSRVLDIGCGQGFYFALYAALGLVATGVELDPLPRAEALRKASALGFTVLASPAEDLPLPDAHFDAVVMSEVLEHLADPAPALAGVARVLKPDGLFLATVPNANYPLAWDPVNWMLEALHLRPIRKGLFAGIWANHERLYRPDLLTTQIAAAGLKPGAVIRQTRWCLPFTHNIVYGFGRALLEGGLLPKRWTAGGLRGGAEAKPKPKALNPIAWAVGLIRLVDRLNGDAQAKGPSQNLCIKARKPQATGFSALL
jgi:2-polyprenyl-6-hydroxyphenyl methylase / 3-demethylubiquinone-9 3-methyltransferase